MCMYLYRNINGKGLPDYLYLYYYIIVIFYFVESFHPGT